MLLPIFAFYDDLLLSKGWNTKAFPGFSRQEIGEIRLLIRSQQTAQQLRVKYEAGCRGREVVYWT
jgi:hypothetical protein